jgi:alpha-beta hydrolase superfamily lysophospholipase
MAELQSASEAGLFYRCWPSNDTQAALLFVHGIGAHSARWDFAGEYFAARGYAGYALELKGFGQTPERPRGHIDSFNAYYRDILTLRKLIAKELPGKPIFLFGESMGSLISFLTAALYPNKFAGQILISPAFANGMKFPISAYLELLFFLLFDRQHQIKMPFTSAMCTRDPAYQQIMENNPDELRTASVKTLINVMLAQLQVKAAAKKITIPTLYLLSGKDYLVDGNFNKKLIPTLPIKGQKVIEYPEMLHALSIDLEREKVFFDTENWLKEQLKK